MPALRVPLVHSKFTTFPPTIEQRASSLICKRFVGLLRAQHLVRPPVRLVASFSRPTIRQPHNAESPPAKPTIAAKWRLRAGTPFVSL